MESMVWREFGLNGLMMGSVITLLFFVIKWTLATTKDILVQASKERELWQEQIKTINNSIVEHNERARGFNESVCEAHKFQRDEHKEMIKSLNEMTLTLGRINGYKNSNG